MKYTIQKIAFIALLLLANGLADAQTFPIQVTAQLAPPYSLTLSDYASSGTDRIVCNVFADISRPELQVKFKLIIQGQNVLIQTRPEFNPPPVTIQGGVLERLTGFDLAAYFDPANLNFQGITRQQFLRTGNLPEGLYRFQLEVIEYNRGVKISNTGISTAWLILNDPPLVNLPKQNEKLKAQDPQNVLIQWTPRHTGSPNAAFTTEYDITLVEVWPETRNPNDAILTSPPVFETTTTSTSILYGPSETPLEPGRRYAFRVRAKSISGVEELNLFKNNGYSEVFTFVYGDACDLPTGIKAEALSSSRIAVSWQSLYNHTGYRVRYRPAGNASSAWYDNTMLFSETELTSLKPNTRYEYQVAASCGSFNSVYSPVAVMTTKDMPEVEYSCGVPLEPFNLSPAELAPSLQPGDVIQAGDFNVTLAKVNGSNGVFSGEGVIVVPYLNKAKVKTEFTSISVNKELRMVNGFMNVTGAGIDVIPEGVLDLMDDLSEGLDLLDSALNTVEANLPVEFDPNSFVADTAINVSAGISSVYKDDDGTVVIVDKNGQETRLPEGTSAAVTDSSGTAYLVDNKGNVHKTDAATAAKAGNREYNLKLSFAAADNGKYGFDKKQHEKLADKYDKLEGNYDVPWKALAAARPDNVLAKLEGSGIDASKIRYEMGGQSLSPNAQSPNTQSLTLMGGANGTEEGLLALYTPADTAKKEQVLGKLNVVTYSEIQHNLIVVPVNGNTYRGTAGSLSTKLNAVYNQGVVNWSVVMAEAITVPNISPFDDGESGLLTNYTPDMKKVVNAYKDNMIEGTFYLFLVSNPKSGSLLGYMPRSKQAGFIFTDKHSSEEALVHTIAHELGHGAFNLQHTFSDDSKGGIYQIPKGTTDNLMDYTANFGTRLYKHQWDKMRFSVIVIGVLEGDGEGAILASIDIIENVETPIEGSYQAPPSNPCLGKAKVLLAFNKVVEIDATTFSLITQLKIEGNRLLSFKIKEVEYVPAFIAKKEGETYVGEETSYYFIDWEGVKTALTNSNSGITKRVIKDANGGDHTVYSGLLNSKYVVKFALNSKCEGEEVVGNNGNCYTVKASDCIYSSGGSGQSTSTGNVINYASTVLTPEEIKKALDGLTTANNKGLNAIIYITDDKTETSKIDLVKEKLSKGTDTQAIIWINIKTDKSIEVKDMRIGNKSIIDKNGVNISSSVQRFLSFALGAFPALQFNPLTAILDGLGGLIKELTIPEKYWNPESVDEKKAPNYSDAFLTVYHYSRALTSMGTSLIFADVQAGKYSIEQIEFATVCGFYDGLITTVAGLPEGASFIIKFIINEDDTRTNVFKAFDQIQASCGKNHIEVYIALPGVQAYGYGKCAWDAIKKHFSTGNACQIAYKSGGAIFQVVTIAIAFAKVGALARVAEVAELFDPLSLAFNGVLKLSKPLVVAGRHLYKAGKHYITFVIENGKYVIKLAKETGEILNNIDWASTIKWAQYTDNLGNTYKVGLLLDQTGVDLAITKIKNASYRLEMSKYPDGKPVEIDGSYQFAEISTGTTGEEMVAVIDRSDDIGGIIDDLLALKIKNKLGDEFLKAVNESPILVKAINGLGDKTDGFLDELVRSSVLKQRVLNNADYVRAFKEFDSKKIYKINGRNPANSGSAGATVNTPSGHPVTFDGNGFPDFTPYVLNNNLGAKHAYKIDMQGNTTTDFIEADRLAGFTSANPRPSGYTWHHHQDGQTMMLVPSNINTPNYPTAATGGINHTGGAATVNHNRDNPSNVLFFPSPSL